MMKQGLTKAFLVAIFISTQLCSTYEAIDRILQNDQKLNGIQLAAIEGKLSIIKQFVIAGGDVNQRYGTQRWSLLYGAIVNKHWTTVHYLLKQAQADCNGLYFGEPLLQHAVRLRCPIDIYEYLANNTNIEQLHFSHEHGWAGMTPLHVAALAGATMLVSHMLIQDINPDWLIGGTTPLHCALAGGHKEVVRLLLVYGADPEKPYHCGKTPLEKAQELKEEGIEAMLKLAIMQKARNLSGRQP